LSGREALKKMNNQRWNRRVWASCAAFDGVESGNDRQSIYQPQDAVMETNRCRALPTGWPAFVLSGSVLLLCMGVAHAASADQNWPQWRGPHGTGVAPHGDPPIEWSETKNVKWKAKIPGSGSATPVIWDNQVFIQTAIPTGRKIEPPAQAPDSGTAAADPSEQNQPARRGRGGGFGGGQKPTEVYQFAILCLDRQTGKALWQQIAREEVPHEGYRQGDGRFG
jgi:hypothetical protein